MKATLMCTLFAATLAGCGNPKNVEIPSDPKEWKTDETFVGALKTLNEGEKEILRRYLMMAAMSTAFGGKDKPEDVIATKVTIGDALEKMRLFDITVADRKAKADSKAAEDKAKADALAAESKVKADALAAELAAKAAAQKAEQEARDAELRSFVTVVFNKKIYLPSNYKVKRFGDSLGIELGFKNNTDKDITAWEGSIKFTDPLGNVLQNSKVNSTESLAAGASGSNTWTERFYDFKAQQKAFRDIDSSKVTFEFTPTQVVFADGTKFPS